MKNIIKLGIFGLIGLTYSCVTIQVTPSQAARGGQEVYDDLYASAPTRTNRIATTANSNSEYFQYDEADSSLIFEEAPGAQSQYLNSRAYYSYQNSRSSYADGFQDGFNNGIFNSSWNNWYSNPFISFGIGYRSFYNPWRFNSFYSPFGFNRFGSPLAWYDPFYDPFFDPFGRYSTFGFGGGWGGFSPYNSWGWGNSFAYPYGYGYGGVVNIGKIVVNNPQSNQERNRYTRNSRTANQLASPRNNRNFSNSNTYNSRVVNNNNSNFKNVAPSKSSSANRLEASPSNNRSNVRILNNSRANQNVEYRNNSTRQQNNYSSPARSNVQRSNSQPSRTTYGSSSRSSFGSSSSSSSSSFGGSSSSSSGGFSSGGGGGSRGPR